MTTAVDKETTFTQRILQWYAVNGRKSLPWHHEPTPYSVWIAEIMLQQTQVNTVKPYYRRFLTRFPDIASLANADLDEVLYLWSGLGYYARARNLHKAAKQVRDQHHGAFPGRFADVLQLPGIGRSTAGAILAFSKHQRHPILDGNVKRVLTRYYAIGGYTGHQPVERSLWALAENHTPVNDVAAYTQAIMDLGATVCTRNRPRCQACPLQDGCKAYAFGSQHQYPHPKPKIKRPEKTVRMLLIANRRGEYLIVKRPPAGIWGGLWCLPELDGATNVVRWSHCNLGLTLTVEKPLPPVKHGLTHFDLTIIPILCRTDAVPNLIGEPNTTAWYHPDNAARFGLPAAIKLIFDTLNHSPPQGNAA